MFKSSFLFICSYVLLSLSLLTYCEAGSDQSPTHNNSLQKRAVCLIPNARKGCVNWKIDACCQACCAQKHATQRWLDECNCVTQGSSVVYVHHQPQPQATTYVVTPPPQQQPTYVVTSPAPQPPTHVTIYH